MSHEKNLRYEFGKFSLDAETETLIRDGAPIPLTRKARQVLLILVQNANQTVEKDEIYNQVWADRFVEDANLTQYIYLLRKKLSQDQNGENLSIETVPGRGYRFNGDVRKVEIAENGANGKIVRNEIPAGDATELEPQTKNENELTKTPLPKFESGETESPSAATPEAEQVKRFRDKNYLVRAGALATIAVFAAIFFYFYNFSAPTKNDEIKSVAVLPFTLIGAERADDKLGLGMADAVITRLSKLQVVPVRPTGAVFRYADQPPANSVVAGRELGVDSVLEGTVQHDENIVRVSVRLVKVSDGKTLWAENFNEKFSDIFTVQDFISARVVQTLSLELSNLQQERLLERPDTLNTEAFQSYQLGNYFWNRRGKEGLNKAVEYFQKAVSIDPNYARAYAMLADSYSMMAYYKFADASEMNEKTITNAETALRLNPDLAEAYIVLATLEILKGDYRRAQENIERAVALAPFNSSARHRYAVILLFNGKLERGVAEMRLAQEYDPLSPAVNKSLCNALISQRSFSEAVRYCEKAFELSPELPAAQSTLAYVYLLDQKYDKMFEQINKKSSDKLVARNLKFVEAYYYALNGRAAEAEGYYAALKTDFEKEPYYVVELTILAHALGKKKEALEYYKKLLDEKKLYPDFPIFFAYDPIWDAIRNDPDFRRIGQPANMPAP
jgi:DNA-binding winged helix-turn-helix (wHTH) protein/TolB-like protein/Flp pilus assembly protein TadD